MDTLNYFLMRQTRYVNVEVLETTPEYVKVKLPFLEIPVTMNHPFFKSRLEKGYFKIRNEQESQIN